MYARKVFYTALCTSQVTSFCYSWVLVPIQRDEGLHCSKSFQTSVPQLLFLSNLSFSLCLSVFPFHIPFVGFNPLCSQLFYLLAAADWWAYGSRCRHMSKGGWYPSLLWNLISFCHLLQWATCNHLSYAAHMYTAPHSSHLWQEFISRYNKWARYMYRRTRLLEPIEWNPTIVCAVGWRMLTIQMDVSIRRRKLIQQNDFFFLICSIYRALILFW